MRIRDSAYKLKLLGFGNSRPLTLCILRLFFHSGRISVCFSVFIGFSVTRVRENLALLPSSWCWSHPLSFSAFSKEVVGRLTVYRWHFRCVWIQAEKIPLNANGLLMWSELSPVYRNLPPVVNGWLSTNTTPSLGSFFTAKLWLCQCVRFSLCVSVVVLCKCLTSNTDRHINTFQNYREHTHIRWQKKLSG